ncbi:MAG: SpoIIE family protein phosphatase [Acidobacteria bacterium]|nr:SpoIIE family protein phosphatase [Acidobacteriota bacterium]
MRVRTQLSLAFLLLAVVPLAGIILYSYSASARAFREAVQAEAQGLVDEVGERMAGIRDDLEILAGKLASPHLGTLLRTDEATVSRAAAAYVEMTRRLEGMEDLVDLVELRSLEDGTEPVLVHPSPTLAQALDKLLTYSRRGPDSGITFDYLLATLAKGVRRYSDLSPTELQALAVSDARTIDLLGSEVASEFRYAGRKQGELKLRIVPSAVLELVLSGTSGDQGEVTYVRDREGEVYADNPEHQTLAETFFPADTGQSPGDDLAPQAIATDEWAVAETRDAETGLTFGIARPIRSELQGIQRTAVRNFSYGLGIVVLAMVGIWLLSGRMTRTLRRLTWGAEMMASGDLTTRIAVHTRDEFGQLAETMNRMALQLSENQERLLREEGLRRQQEVHRRLLEAENERQTRELEEARTFQLSLLPRTLPEHPELDIAVFMRTATEVGGDYYDFFPGSNGALTTAIGDAAGHGMRAGTMVTVVKGLFTARAGEMDLPQLLEEAAHAIKQMNLRRMNMAVSLVRYAQGRLTISAAGMPPALLYRDKTRQLEEVTLEGLPLGGLAQSTYRQWDTTLAAGDTLLLMTDGFPELLNGDDDPLGYPRVHDLFESCASRDPEEIISELSAAADQWTNGQPPADDITFVVMKARSTLRARRKSLTPG